MVPTHPFHDAASQTVAVLGNTIEVESVSAIAHEHLDDILRNAAVFQQKWGWWPMEGWLQGFAALGLIGRDAAGAPFRLGTDDRPVERVIER